MRQEFIIAYSSIASVFIPLSIAIAHNKHLPAELKPLVLILIISLVCDMLAFFLVKYSLNTLWIVNFFMIAQFSLLMRIFNEQFDKKRVIKIVYIFFALFYLINITFFQGPIVINSVSNVIACLILITCCLYYFYKLLNDLPTVHIQALPMLWIAFAVLTYYAGNFFLFLVSNYLVEGAADAHRMVWILHNLLNIIKNVLFAVALWQSYRKLKSSTLSSSVP